MSETIVNDLKINKLTKAQYDTSSKSATELWFVTDESAATKPATMPVLTAIGWTSGSQTVSVQGVTATNTVFVSPAPASTTAYGQAGIICIAQSTNSLTFTCSTTPTTDITVNVVIF